MRFNQVLEERLTEIKAATSFTMDDAVIIPCRLQTQVLVGQLRAALAGIKLIDEVIEYVADMACSAHYRTHTLIEIRLTRNVRYKHIFIQTIIIH